MGVLGALLVAPLLVVQLPAAGSDILPLNKLRLYETGVGYFERSGQVRGARRTALPLPAGHLDDALKTLVVLSSGSQVEIGGIEFASAVSEGMARAMAGLPLEAESELRYVDLLRSLEGVEVELRTDQRSLRGRLVEVLGPYAPPLTSAGDLELAAALHQLAGEVDAEVEDAEGDGEHGARPSEPEYTLVLRGARGSLHRVRTRELQSIRPIEAGAAARMEVALSALSSRAAQATHPLAVQIRGAGPLQLGYIAETPVWRTTYRVVLDDKGGAQLQAWALLHNDTDEDWQAVQVELVNGQPTSFLFPLAAPRYAHRELAEPEVELSTVPQLLNTTADRLWGDFVDGEGAGGYGSLGTRGYGGGIGISMGHGVAMGSGGLGVALGTPTLGDLAGFAQATGEETRSLFVYRLPAPLDLAAHHSALVPVVQRRIDAEPISWFAGDSDQARAGARLVNTTNQTLPAGTLAVFGAGGFSGESGFERLKPGEQMFAVHGVDLDVDLERAKTLSTVRTTSVQASGESLVEQQIVESRIEISLHNRSGQARAAYVTLPVQRNATVDGHPDLDFDHVRGLPLARFELAAGKKLQAALRSREANSRATAFADLDARRLATLAREKALPKAGRELLTQAAALRRKIEDSRQQRARHRERIDKVEKELERLRQDLRAMGSARITDHSTRELGKRVVAREGQIDALTQDIEQASVLEARLDQQVGVLLKKI